MSPSPSSPAENARPPVLILGAGINGCAVARELVLNGVGVVVVDKHDVSFGATARSSRLIHGGLRYLEYGDFSLVRESLLERNRLLKLSPQYVRPLELFIPVKQRAGGMVRSGLRFIGLSRIPGMQRFSKPKNSSRGLWLVQMGLRFYDWVSRGTGLPTHRVMKASEVTVPRIDSTEFPWLASYVDAQILSPERFCLAMLEDARRLAADQEIPFLVRMHHTAELEGNTARLRDELTGQSTETLQPALVINATGAWGDLTLDELKVSSRRLFGGTKGSHFLTRHEDLKQALGDKAIYAEAPDGRLIFVLPLGELVMVGTTDERFELPPEKAIATQVELRYLVEMVNLLFSGFQLTLEDVDFHYCGVRPLPYAEGRKPGAIPRGHSIHEDRRGDLPFLTLIGGKLTTCRQFGEDVSTKVLDMLHKPRRHDTRTRPFPGGENYPEDAYLLQSTLEQLAEETGFSLVQTKAVWQLYGTRAVALLREVAQQHPPEQRSVSISNTAIPRVLISWILQNEWCRTLADLVERRLILIYTAQVTRATLQELAQEMHHMLPDICPDPEAAVQSAIEQLDRFYGYRVD